MIARPKISRNEWKTAEIGAFEVGNFALFCCPGDGLAVVRERVVDRAPLLEHEPQVRVGRGEARRQPHGRRVALDRLVDEALVLHRVAQVVVRLRRNRPPVRGVPTRTLELGHIDVDAADFGTNRVLSSSSRSEEVAYDHMEVESKI